MREGVIGFLVLRPFSHFGNFIATKSRCGEIMQDKRKRLEDLEKNVTLHWEQKMLLLCFLSEYYVICTRLFFLNSRLSPLGQVFLAALTIKEAFFRSSFYSGIPPPYEVPSQTGHFLSWGKEWDIRDRRPTDRKGRRHVTRARSQLFFFFFRDFIAFF